MKYRTFTVLFVEEYDPANGVVMTDDEAVKELRDAIQDSYDEGTMTGTNFLIVKVEDGSDKFWDEWDARSVLGDTAT